MKNKRGFTLIELLAIIVILAIIAVITIPILLNVIENSRKGAATDSAYGFKDSINKYYVDKLSDTHNLKLQGDYEVKSGGILKGNFGVTTEDEERTIPISGTIPSSGSLHYTNNVLDGGYLVIGEYKVTFNSNGSVEKTEKNTSSNNNQNNNATTQYTVTFNYNNGDDSTSETVNSGVTITKPSNPINGEYSFGGWFSDENLTTPFNFATSITSNTNLYAKYLSNYYQWSNDADDYLTYDEFNSDWPVWIQTDALQNKKEACVVFNNTPICIRLDSDTYDCDLDQHTCTENGYIMKKVNESIQAGATCKLFPIINEGEEDEYIYRSISCSLGNSIWSINAEIYQGSGPDSSSSAELAVFNNFNLDVDYGNSCRLMHDYDGSYDDSFECMNGAPTELGNLCNTIEEYSWCFYQ